MYYKLFVTGNLQFSRVSLIFPLLLAISRLKSINLGFSVFFLMLYLIDKTKNVLFVQK